MQGINKVPSIGTAIKALQILASNGAGLSLAEMSECLQSPRTSVFRILTTLCNEGMAEKRGTLYFAGIEILRLGLLTAGQRPTWKKAGPFLAQLTEAVGETSHLGVATAKGVLIVEVNECPHPLSAASHPGTVADYHASATGKVLLAFSAGITPDLCSEPLTRRTPKTLTDKQALVMELKTVRSQGFALDDEEYFEGVRCLAAPIRNSSGVVLGAIGITAAATRFTRTRIPEVAAKVCAIAQAIGSSIHQF